MILNFGSGIVGGIWLAFLGEWKLIGIGILLLFTAQWILSLLMMPGVLIAGITVHFAKKNIFLLYFFGFLSQLYTNILIVATCVISFFICSIFYKGSIGIGYIPYALWSWGMALGPWQFFASKEPDNMFSTITLFSASFFYFLFLGSIFISPFLALIIVGISGLVQLIVLPTYNIYLANKMENY
jgi:hypothetical protein